MSEQGRDAGGLKGSCGNVSADSSVVGRAREKLTSKEPASNQETAPVKALGEAFESGLPAGSEELAAAYNHHCEDLNAHALSILHSKERAEDAVQSAFARTLSALRQGKRIDEMAGWLHRCVHNACIDELRTTQFEDGADLDELPGLDDPAEITDWRDRCRDVYRATADLPKHVREAFLLAEVQGLSYSEIAGEMERTVESVRYLIFRARSYLRETAGRQAKAFTAPILEVLHPAQPKTGSVEHIRGFLSVKADKVHAHLASLIDRAAQLASSPALPLAVSILVVGGVLDGVPGDRHLAVERSGTEEAAFPRGLDQPVEPVVGHVLRADVRSAKGEAGLSVPNDSLRNSRLPVPVDGQNVVGGDRQPAESAAGHDEGQSESVGSAGDNSESGVDVFPPYEDPPTETKEPGAPPESAPTPPDPLPGAYGELPGPRETDGRVGFAVQLQTDPAEDKNYGEPEEDRDYGEPLEDSHIDASVSDGNLVDGTVNSATEQEAGERG